MTHKFENERRLPKEQATNFTLISNLFWGPNTSDLYHRCQRRMRRRPKKQIGNFKSLTLSKNYRHPILKR
jgi:hypothetical protein